MKNRFCCLFLLFSHAATAQFADLMKDKNVAWVAESYIDVRLDILNQSDHKDIYDQTGYGLDGGLSILKYQDTKNVEVSEGLFFFANTLIEAVKNKQLTVYADSLCIQPIDALSLLYKIDTIQQIDPNSYETTIKVVSNWFNAEDIKLFRAHQITYYSLKNNRWASKTLAVAPLVMDRDNVGNFVAWKPLFWLKVANKKADLNTVNTTWAIRRRSNATENMILLNTVKIHKKIGEDVPMQHFLTAVKTNPKLPVYQINDWHNKVLLSTSDKENIFASIDTTQTIDPVTYETKTKIIQRDLEVKAVNKLRLVQEWAWDNKRKVLSVRCLAIAPMRDVKNEVGEFLFNLPLFYQRFDD